MEKFARWRRHTLELYTSLNIYKKYFYENTAFMLSFIKFFVPCWIKFMRTSFLREWNKQEDVMGLRVVLYTYFSLVILNKFPSEQLKGRS